MARRRRFRFTKKKGRCYRVFKSGKLQRVKDKFCAKKG